MKIKPKTLLSMNLRPKTLSSIKLRPKALSSSKLRPVSLLSIELRPKTLSTKLKPVSPIQLRRKLYKTNTYDPFVCKTKTLSKTDSP